MKFIEIYYHENGKSRKLINVDQILSISLEHYEDHSRIVMILSNLSNFIVEYKSREKAEGHYIFYYDILMKL